MAQCVRLSCGSRFASSILTHLLPSSCLPLESTSRHLYVSSCHMMTDTGNMTKPHRLVPDTKQRDTKQVMAAANLANRLASLSTIESVLSLLHLQHADFDLDCARLFLARIVQLSPDIPPEELAVMVRDPRFDRLAESLHSGATSLSMPVLLDTLDCMLRSGEDTFLLRSMEVQLTWMMRKMSITQLVKVVQLYQGHQSNKDRKERFDSAMQQIERRWLEIDNIKHVISLLYAAGPSQTHLWTTLEERALSLASKTTPKDLYRLIYLLSRQRRRNTPLIRAIIHQMSLSDHLDLSPVQLANLLYAFATLSVYDIGLIEKVTDNITGAIHRGELDDIVIASVLRSIGILRWRQQSLLDSLSAVAMTTELWPTFLATCSSVGYLPLSVQVQLPELMSKLKNTASLRMWLDAIWCCALVSKCDNQMAEGILCESFQRALTESGLTDLLPVQKRLLDIDAVARLELPDYNGPLLDHNQFVISEIGAKQNRHLLECVLGAIINMAPADKYLRVEVTTPYGHMIDVELILNEKGEPQPLLQFEGVFQGHSEGTVAVPANYHRIALKLLDFSDMTLYDIQPSGRHSMVIRHLQCMGFTVVQVPYHEFSQYKKVVQRVQYLERKIKESIVPQGGASIN